MVMMRLVTIVVTMSAKDVTLFFFNDTGPTEIYTLSLHDALPICRDPVLRLDQPPDGSIIAPEIGWGRSRIRPVRGRRRHNPPRHPGRARCGSGRSAVRRDRDRSEEHTSELQSHVNLVCRLLLEKK